MQFWIYGVIQLFKNIPFISSIEIIQSLVSVLELWFWFWVCFVSFLKYIVNSNTAFSFRFTARNRINLIQFNSNSRQLLPLKPLLAPPQQQEAFSFHRVG
ncbi:hypothetical protein RTP6_007657 [Batrachochytrium dendrobatidis]